MTTLTQVETANGQFGLWCHAFQGANTTWLSLFEQRIRAGNFFLGLQAHNVQVFDAQIPPRAIIESAQMRVTAFQTGGAARFVNINTPDRFDGTTLRAPLERPLEYFTGWRYSANQQAVGEIRSTTATNIATLNPNGAANIGWLFRQIQAGASPIAGASPTPNSGHRDRMAALFTTAGAGSLTIGEADLTLYRSAAAPIGDFRVEVFNAIVDPNGNALVPDEGTGAIATSDAVSMASFTTVSTGAVVTLTFSGADQITLSPSTNYFLVMRPDEYAINNSAWMAMRARTQFLTGALLYHYGEGIGCDWQNFPGTTDVFSAATPPTSKLGTNVAWNIPTFIAGQSYFTPDITELVRAQVNNPNYVDRNQGIVVATGETGGGNSNRVWRSNGHPALTPPRLDVVWRKRRVYVV